MKNGTLLTVSMVALALGASLALPRLSLGADAKDSGQIETIKGEVVDLMCYLDHGAKGDKHKGCATKCIEGGGPVGLLTADNKLYLVVGDHAPMNKELAAKAAETITLKGKVVEKHGVKMIENAVIQE
jgi:hypothetical protein